MIATALPLLAALLFHAPLWKSAHASFPSLDIVETSTQAALDAQTAEPQVYYRHLMNFAGRSLADATLPACGSSADCPSSNRCVNGVCRPCGSAAQRACEVNGALQCNDGFDQRNGFCFTSAGGLFNFNFGGGTNVGVTAGNPPTTPTTNTPPTTPPQGGVGTSGVGVYGPPPTVPPPPPPPVVPPPPTTPAPPPPPPPPTPSPVLPPPTPVSPPPPPAGPVAPPAPVPGAPPTTGGPVVVPAPPGEEPNDVDPFTPPGQVPPRVIVIIVPPTARARPFAFPFFGCGFAGSPCCITVLPFISSAYCFGSSTCQTDTLFPSCEATPSCAGVRVGNTCNTFF